MGINNFKKKYEVQKNLNQRQSGEIERLKEKISKLEDDRKRKEDLINSVSDVREDLYDTIKELKEKQKEYAEIIQELNQMKTVMNQTIFKGRWKLIRLLMK